MGFRDFLSDLGAAAWIMSSKDVGRWATKGCGTCKGTGIAYKGLRALPGVDRGTPSEVCGCVQANRKAHVLGQRAAAEAPEPVYPSLEQQLFSDGVVPGETDEEREAFEARVRAKRKRETEAGEMTLCCKRYSCRCGQNLRLRNGVPTRYPGSFLPGSVDEKRFHQAKAQYEAHQDIENACETTLPLPAMFGSDFRRVRFKGMTLSSR
jgi:hypothetical protein